MGIHHAFSALHSAEGRRRPGFCFSDIAFPQGLIIDYEATCPAPISEFAPFSQLARLKVDHLDILHHALTPLDEVEMRRVLLEVVLPVGVGGEFGDEGVRVSALDHPKATSQSRHQWVDGQREGALPCTLVRNEGFESGWGEGNKGETTTASPSGLLLRPPPWPLT